MQHIITPSDVKSMARGVSAHVADSKIQIYIEESENIDAKRALGDALFIDMINCDETDKYAELLSGGEYETSRGEKRYFYGLKKALCYYAYARLMKNGDYNGDRYGTSVKQGEYSSNAAYKEKVTAYNDAFAVGDVYLTECVMYLKENADKYPLYKGMGKIKSNRTTFKIIGE